MTKIEDLIEYGRYILNRTQHETSTGGEKYQPDRRIGDYVLAGIALLEYVEGLEVESDR